MKKEFKGQSKKGGVYQIRNLKNGKIYIGSAKCFQVRASQHQTQLRNQKHHNKHLQVSWDKHGADAFLFEIVEVVNGDRKARTAREQFFISQWKEQWKQCYNFNKKADSSDRTCWSKKREGFSEEHKQKLSESIKAFYRDNPEKAKKAGERLMKARPTDAAAKVYKTHLVAPDKREYTVIRNLAKFAFEHGLCDKHLYEVIQGKRIHHNGWVLKSNEKYCGIRKMSMKDETKQKIAEANIGQKHSNKTKEKLRERKLGTKNPNFGKQMPMKTKKALIEANTGRQVSEHVINSLIKSRQKTYDIKIKDPDGNVYGPITNLSNFCKKYNLERSLLIKVIQGKRQHHKSWALVE